MTMETNGASTPIVADSGYRATNTQRPVVGANSQAVDPQPIRLTESNRASEPAARGDAGERYSSYQRLGRMSEGEMNSLVREVNTHLETRNLELNYRKHEGTNQYFLTIYNRDTQEIVREIPPEWSLDMLAKVWEMTGIFVNERG
ncbi:MAG: flagellar protein FlaG [Defluviitaleaceae bacterium]|nr:flagellar protein FlaG [Defluviitaleaceae bacterium]